MFFNFYVFICCQEAILGFGYWINQISFGDKVWPFLFDEIWFGRLSKSILTSGKAEKCFSFIDIYQRIFVCNYSCHQN